MTERIKREYHVKDVEMFIAISTITENALANQEFLITKRSRWTASFFEDIRTRIDNLIETHLGADNAKALRNATAAVIKVKNAALTELAEVKVQITEDYKKQPARKDEILILLGFRDFHRDAALGDQEALINLLYRYKTNLTTELKKELVANDISETTLNSIMDYANSLKETNVIQESKKGERHEITRETIALFNDIYQEVISIANMSKKFYKGNPAKADQFNFSKITKRINQTRQAQPAA